jgi:hypothetical protein
MIYHKSTIIFILTITIIMATANNPDKTAFQNVKDTIGLGDKQDTKDDSCADQSMFQKAKDAVGFDKSAVQETKDKVGSTVQDGKDKVGVDRSAGQKAKDAIGM